MRRVLLALSWFVFAACASRDGIIDERTLDCAAGGDLSVDVVLNMPRVMVEGTQDALTMVVAVSNNSHHDIEVKSIRVEPGYTAQQRYALEGSFREFNHVLGPGEDENFELPVRGVAGHREPNRRIGNEALEVTLTIPLGSGDVYRCTYDVPAPR